MDYMWRQMTKLRIKDTTLSTMYVPWDKSKIAASDLQDGEQSKTLDNGVEDTIRAIYTCMDFADFDSVKFITSKEVIDIRGEDLLQDGIVCEEPSIPITNMKDYARFMIYHLTEHVDTNYTLTIQHDGFIVNPDQWRDEYYDYDYIGAPWPHFQSHNVGNGGFSLRSKALVESVQNFLLPSDLSEAEDVVVCRYLRSRLEDKCGLTFAPLSIAETFAYEMKRTKLETFGFHGVFHLPEVMQDDIETLFDVIHPHSVAKHFRSFRDACNKLPADGQRLFHNYCSNNMAAMITQAKTIAKEQFLASSS